jgi:hypothetical protein
MSELHDQLADALIEVLEGDAVKVGAYKWGPGAIKPDPVCAVIEMPGIRRTEPDQAEDHVGADDWRFVFPVVFYVDLKKDVQKSQAQILSRVEAWIKAIDRLQPSSAGLILNDLCLDAKVVEAEPFSPEDESSRSLLAYETRVAVFSFQ